MTPAWGFAHQTRAQLGEDLAAELNLVAAWIADRRQCSFQPRDPWPTMPGDTSWPLAELVHLSATPTQPLHLPKSALAEAESLGLIAAENEGGYTPGRWQLTARQNVFAVRDRPTHVGPGRVFIGDDGIRLLDTVLAAQPTGRVLDIGCGAGLATAGAARSADHIHGIDTVAECIEATRLSACLSGVGDRVTASHDNLLDYTPPEPVDCVVANLPGVPVPQGLAYPPAGDGGPDGLRLARHLLDRLPAWTAHRRHGVSQAPVLIMRLQSPGDPTGPFVLTELRALASGTGLDIEVITDTRIDVRVRDGLTIHYARQLNPHRAGLDELVRSHSSRLAMTHYYSSAVLARPGSGTVRHIDLAIGDWLNHPLDIKTAPTKRQAAQIRARYYASTARLPMGFWELASTEHLERPAERLTSLVQRLASGQTALQSVLAVFTNDFSNDPTGSLPMLSATGLLIETLQAVPGIPARSER